MKKLHISIISLLMILCLFGCSSNSNSYKSATTESFYDEVNFSTSDYTSDTADTLNNNINEKSKIIYTVNINYETKDFDSAVKSLNQKIDKYEGYIVSRDEYKYGEDYKYISGNYTIRIPADKYKEFLSDSEEIGNITSLSENAEDITDEYIDTSARLENLKIEEETLQNLLSQATSISDIIEIQSSLSQVRSDIESYESRIKYYDTLTEYATINVSISQVSVYTSNKSTLEKFVDLLKDSLSGFKDALVALFRVLIYALPYIIVVGIIILIIIKANKNKKGKQ